MPKSAIPVRLRVTGRVMWVYGPDVRILAKQIILKGNTNPANRPLLKLDDVAMVKLGHAVDAEALLLKLLADERSILEPNLQPETA